MVDAKQEAHDDWERNKSFWEGRCVYCTAGLEMVQEQMGVTRDQALTLFAALLVQDAANKYYWAVSDWKTMTQKMMPLIQPISEQAKEGLRKPWEGES